MTLPSLSAQLQGQFDPALVTVSVIIAIAASYAALDLAGRVTAAQGQARVVWLAGGSLAMGTGIWSMHYVGMLAYTLPVEVRYNWPLVLASLVAAVLASAVALFVVSRTRLGARAIVMGGALMGAGIASMHYIGMAAMRLPAICGYSSALVALSVLLAIVISIVALWLAFHFREATTSGGWRKFGSATLMGVAIPTMHYTGMAAATFVPLNVAPDYTASVAISSLGLAGIIGATAMVLGIAIATSLVDRRFSAQNLAHDRSEQRLRELVEAERTQTQEFLQQTQELARVNRVMLMGEMTASIAHEVNQPLTGIVANAGTGLRYLAAEVPDLDEVRRYFELIVRDGKRAAEVIGRIRALVKRVPERRDRLDLNESVLEVIALAQNELQRNPIELQTNLVSDLPRVRADRVQLQQVILNLIVNALEAMNEVGDRPHELVVTSGESDANEVFVEVRDSGPGLDAANVDRLFRSFYTTKTEGMGMGLSISRMIVESHGGRLWATANEPHGAVFRFTLPILADVADD